MYLPSLFRAPSCTKFHPKRPVSLPPPAKTMMARAFLDRPSAPAVVVAELSCGALDAVAFFCCPFVVYVEPATIAMCTVLTLPWYYALQHELHG